MDVTAPANQVTVARYDDDYPLLYGEPARQPTWPPRKAVQGPKDGVGRDTAGEASNGSGGKAR